MNSPLYDNIDSNDIESRKEYSRMYQPNFTRSRQIYRGPRDSEKTNLEIQQLAYDLAYVHAQLNHIQDISKDFSLMLEEGLGYDREYIWADLSDPISRYDSSTDLEYQVDPDSVYDLIAESYRQLEMQKKILESTIKYVMESL